MPAANPSTNILAQPNAHPEREPIDIHPVVERINAHASELRSLRYEFLPHLVEAEKEAAAVEFASESEKARDVTAAARQYKAEAREKVRAVLAETSALAGHADLIPLAASQARKVQNSMLGTPRAQALTGDLASRFQVAETSGLTGQPHLALARELHDQFTRERDQAGLYALRVVARPYLKAITGDEAHAARGLLRTFHAEDEAARGDVPRLEVEQASIKWHVRQLENEISKLIQSLNERWPEPPDVWAAALTAEPDPRAAWDALPGLWEQATRYRGE